MTNYYQLEYQKKDGSIGKKEFTSTTKSASQLGAEAKAWCKEKGYKFKNGHAGNRH